SRRVTRPDAEGVPNPRSWWLVAGPSKRVQDRLRSTEFRCSVPSTNRRSPRRRGSLFHGSRRRQMKRLRWQGPLLAVAIALCSAGAARGQTVSTTTGAINGKVTDATGAVLPGVTVAITSPAMQGTRTDVTKDDGAYRFSAIPPGEYQVTYELSGFEKVI